MRLSPIGNVEYILFYILFIYYYIFIYIIYIFIYIFIYLLIYYYRPGRIRQLPSVPTHARGKILGLCF